MYEGSPVTFSFRALRESDTLQAGSARLQVLHMPGHTPQSLSLLVTAERRDYERMLTELHRIGYDRVQRYLSGGIKAWILSGRSVARLAQISCEAVQKGAPAVLLDVRTDAEWEGGHVQGAKHVPLADILNGNIPDLAKGENIVAYCRSGFRSNIAGSVLAQAGFTSVQSMAGA